MMQVSSAAASAVSEVVASAAPASPAAAPAGARAADNTVCVEVAGKETKVHPQQSCASFPGLEDSWTFAGNIQGGGQFVISMFTGGKSNLRLLGGQVTGTGNFENLLSNPDGTFYGTTAILDHAVSFSGHCDSLKK